MNNNHTNSKIDSNSKQTLRTNSNTYNNNDNNHNINDTTINSNTNTNNTTIDDRYVTLRPFVILRIVRPRIFESEFRNHCAKKLVGALRKPTSFV